MSRSPEPRDDGFSMVEVIVAFGVLMILMVALLPQLVLGIKATGSARLVTQAKGVSQGQLEKMRNLPYYLSPLAGDFRDVLDTYYRNRTAPAATPTCTTTAGNYVLPLATWSGYVPAASPRCDYEPVGALYRKVSTVYSAAAGADFTVVVDTRFLSGATPPQPVTPPTAYNSQSISASRPAASQLGVTVTILYTDHGELQRLSTYTQIADRPVVTVRVRAEANATAVEVGSATTAQGPVSLSVGLLNLVGNLTYTSTVNANLAATSAGLATGVRASGAAKTLAAPPTTAAGVMTAGAGSLLGSGCDIVCWGSTKLNLSPVSADGGLPQAGTQTAPMQALLTDFGHNGISFGNSSASEYRPELKLTAPLLRVSSGAEARPSGISAGCVAGGSGTSSLVSASGYLHTTEITDPSAPSTVDSCAVARASSMSLFPTDFAPGGVVVVTLTRASARCTVAGVTHSASTAYDYSAVVSYWNGSGYATLATIVPGMTTDPLEALNLSTTTVGGTRTLGDYIASWSALTSSEVTQTQANGTAEVTLPGIVTIASQPTRADTSSPDGLDATSVVSVAIGALGCLAEDQR